MSWVDTLVGAGIGTAGAIFSARQANRFAERMSSTAHQREVKDLERAGLNPMLSANRGASTPQGTPADITGGIQRGVSTALAVRQQRAAIGLMEAQADAAGASAGLSRTQAADISNTAAAGRLRQISAGADREQLAAKLDDMTFDERRQVIVSQVEKAREEIRLTASSADRAKIAAELDELLKTGRINENKFAERVGEAGPAVNLLLEIIRALGPIGLGAAILQQRKREADVEAAPPPPRPKIGF